MRGAQNGGTYAAVPLQRVSNAVILHEFNGHACRYRHRCTGKVQGVLFYMPFRDAIAIATCASSLPLPPPPTLPVRASSGAPRAAEINKRAAKESRLKGEAISIPRVASKKKHPLEFNPLSAAASLRSHPLPPPLRIRPSARAPPRASLL